MFLRSKNRRRIHQPRLPYLTTNKQFPRNCPKTWRIPNITTTLHLHCFPPASLDCAISAPRGGLEWQRIPGFFRPKSRVWWRGCYHTPWMGCSKWVHTVDQWNPVKQLCFLGKGHQQYGCFMRIWTIPFAGISDISYECMEITYIPRWPKKIFPC